MAPKGRFQKGSLLKRGIRSKVWVARWWENAVGTDGKTERIRRSEILGAVAEIPTRRKAEQLLSDRLRQINSGGYRPQSTWTFRNFVQDRWLPDSLPTLKHSTKLHYEYVTATHLIPEFGNIQLRLITRESVQGFLNRKLRSGLSWKTVKHIRTTFGTILKAAETYDLLTNNPVLKTKLPRRNTAEEKTPIAPESLLSLLEALPEPSKSLAWLLVLTGLRIGELLALRWREVDLEIGFVRVRQTVYEGQFDDPKTKRSRRTVPLGKKGVELLIARKPANADPESLVFASKNGTPLSRRNLLNRQLKPISEQVGLKGTNWHWLRHANATMLDAVGAPLGTVQALLGHSSPEITREVYLHSVPADAKGAVQRVEDLVIGPKRTQVSEWPEMRSRAIN
jgi:integrase